MNARLTLALALALAFFWADQARGQQAYERQCSLMGCRFELIVVANGQQEADASIDTAIAEMRRVERLISDWDSLSQTSEINRRAGVSPVEVDKELFDLVGRCVALSRLTDGAFDISYASMDRVWRFDGSMTRAPSAEEVRRSVEKVGYQNIVLDSARQTVFLSQTGMKIGFGAVGKGYAADRAKRLLVSLGVPAGIVSASGDMSAWGLQPDGQHWTIAITNPFNPRNAFAVFALEQGAVATSGDYEKFAVLDGIRYSHIINPLTGYPVTGLASVTVFAPSAELSDALATAVFVLGVEAGLDRVNQLPNVECVIIDSQGGIHQSNNIKINEED